MNPNENFQCQTFFRPLARTPTETIAQNTYNVPHQPFCHLSGENWKDSAVNEDILLDHAACMNIIVLSMMKLVIILSISHNRRITLDSYTKTLTDQHHARHSLPCGQPLEAIQV